MLSQDERKLLIKTQETIHDATKTAKIFGVSKSTVYARIRDYKARGTIKLRTNLRGRKSRITLEDEERIKELIEKNNVIVKHSAFILAIIFQKDKKQPDQFDPAESIIFV